MAALYNVTYNNILPSYLQLWQFIICTPQYSKLVIPLLNHGTPFQKQSGSSIKKRHCAFIIRCSEISYDLPTSFNKTSYKFGTGSRFTKTAHKTDLLCEYNIPSYFNSTGKRYSFGQNWEAYSKVYYEQKPNVDASLPGPGSYNIDPTCFTSGVRNITIKRRIKSIRLNSNPGPGNYDSLSTFSKSRQVYSKYSNPTMGKIFPGKRFTYKVCNSPSPGTYDADRNNYTSVVSNYQRSVSHTFGKLRRKLVHAERGRLETPGPGSYSTLSDFDWGQSGKSNRYFKTHHLSVAPTEYADRENSTIS